MGTPSQRRAERKKIEAIKEAERPSNASEKKSFSGMAQYLTHFIPHFSSLTEPLRRLTKKDARFSWGHREEQAFKSIKTALSDCKTLEYFNVKLQTEVMVEASPVGLGTILTQIGKKLS